MKKIGSFLLAGLLSLSLINSVDAGWSSTKSTSSPSVSRPVTISAPKSAPSAPVSVPKSSWSSTKPSPVSAPAPKPAASAPVAQKQTVAPANVGTASDAALANKSRQASQANSAQSRDAQIAKFKADNAVKYNNSFTSEPVSRPSYIPSYYRDSYGASRGVYFDPYYHSYGYYDSALARFIVIDALADAAARSVVQPTVVYPSQGYYPQTVVYTHSSHAVGITFLVLFILIGGGVVVYVVTRSRF